MSRVDQTTTTVSPESFEPPTSSPTACAQPQTAPPPAEIRKASDKDEFEMAPGQPTSAPKPAAGDVNAGMLARLLKNEGDQVTVALGADGKLGEVVGGEGEMRVTLTRTGAGYEMAVAEKAAVNARLGTDLSQAKASLGTDQTFLYEFADPDDLAKGIAAAGVAAYGESLIATKGAFAAARVLGLGVYDYLNEHCTGVELSGAAAGKFSVGPQMFKAEGFDRTASVESNLKATVRIDFGKEADGNGKPVPGTITIKKQLKGKASANPGFKKVDLSTTVTSSQTMLLDGPATKDAVLKGRLPRVASEGEQKLTFTLEGSSRTHFLGAGEGTGSKCSVTVKASELEKAGKRGAEAVGTFLGGDPGPLVEALKDVKVEVDSETFTRYGWEGKYGLAGVSVTPELTHKEVTAKKPKETVTAGQLGGRFSL